jgi:hypothetical protein
LDPLLAQHSGANSYGARGSMEIDDAGSEVSSTSSNQYFQRRYDGRTTRREALEKLGRHQRDVRNTGVRDIACNAEPEHAQNDTTDTYPNAALMGLNQSDTTGLTTGTGTSKPVGPRKEDSRPRVGDAETTHFTSGPSPTRMNMVGDSDGRLESPARPQHNQNDETEYHYKIIYRGVVALLSEPSESAARSGAYVSYGEIIASREKVSIEGFSSPSFPLTPTRQTTPIDDRNVEDMSAQCSASRPRNGCGKDGLGDIAVRVDRVLTGGYSVDGTQSGGDLGDKTPRRANTHPHLSLGPSSLPMDAPTRKVSDPLSNQDAPDGCCHGYILAQRRMTPVLLPLRTAPTCVRGTFLYKVASSTPLRIYTGPCISAPQTKGMLIPGTIHEVSLRVSMAGLGGWFLRLTRRRGWVVDRRAGNDKQGGGFILMQDLGSKGHTSNSSPLLGPSLRINVGPVTYRKHHRAPRRMKQVKNEQNEGSRKSGHFLGSAQVDSGHVPADTSNHSDSAMIQSNERVVLSPSSNVSLLSDDSSFEHHQHYRHGTATPDRSISRSVASSTIYHPAFFLMRVNAPRGLKILDAPHFQVNNLIRGSHTGASYSHSPMGSKDFQTNAGNQSIFQTMGGHHTTTLTSRISNPAVFDSVTKARKLPRGSLFEAAKRIETPGSFHQGAGLIKLSDNSGWAIVPRQEDLDGQYRSNFGALGGIKEGEATRAYEEVGNAVIDDHHSPVYCRILSRGGVAVSLPPACAAPSEGNTSPTSSSAGYSSIEALSQVHSKDSDVASSVGSSFLDAMFRTPSKKGIEQHHETRRETVSTKLQVEEKTSHSTVIQCGMFAEVERWVDPFESGQHPQRIEFVRLRGGQGWLPRYSNGRPVLEIVELPESRFGSFWFRVQHQSGIKVRMGPSQRAPSIKSDEGAYFRFECGEFLRASEIVTYFQQGAPIESFAKLYRNRHVRLVKSHDELRSLASLTSPAEWVQVFGRGELYLEECSGEPRIERNKRQGWRYNVVLDARVHVRQGPSFGSDTNGVVLLGGESVLINERVIGPNDTISWLRLKDGQGWVHSIGEEGDILMIPHSLRHRRGAPGALFKTERDVQEDLPYNAIIARLFHGDISDGSGKPNV